MLIYMWENRCCAWNLARKAKRHSMRKWTTGEQTVFSKLEEGFRLLRGPTGVWEIEKPITRDLQHEERQRIHHRTCLGLLRKGLIEPDGTWSSLRGCHFYRMTALAKARGTSQE
jgi:hypothetical protein